MSERKRVVRVNRDTLYRDLHGEGILLQLDSGRYFGLEGVAHRMWQLITEHGDLKLVEDALRSEYAVEPEVLSADLDRFVGELVDRKLVEMQEIPAET